MIKNTLIFYSKFIGNVLSIYILTFSHLNDNRDALEKKQIITVIRGFISMTQKKQVWISRPTWLHIRKIYYIRD